MERKPGAIAKVMGGLTIIGILFLVEGLFPGTLTPEDGQFKLKGILIATLIGALTGPFGVIMGMSFEAWLEKRNQDS